MDPWKVTLSVSFLLGVVGCGQKGTDAATVDLEEEARGIPWEILSGKIVYARWETPAPGTSWERGFGRGRMFLIDVAARQVRLLRDEVVSGKPPHDTISGYVRDLAIRRDGTSITFALMDPETDHWELRDLSFADGTERVLYPDDHAHHLYPSWSKDGHLAYVVHGVSWGMFVDGVFLLSGPDNSRLAWTASGAVIVSLENVHSQGNLYLADPATHAITPVVVSSDPDWDAEIFSAPALSLDETKLAYVRWGRGIVENVWVADANGTHPVQLSFDYGQHPAWSADGKSVLFAHKSASPAYGSNLYLADVATGALTQVTQHEADYVDWAP